MKTIVILGAGIAAAPLIRQTMVNSVLKRDDLKLVVVAPNSHFHWPIAMPRVVIPGQMADDKVLVPLEPIFKEYPASKFEFVQGKASSLDPSSKLVVVALNSGGSQSVKYDVLIIATGARARDDMPWKNLDTTELTKAKVHSIQDQVKKAKVIVVGGGGVTGVETAGELGSEYGKTGAKEIILVHSGALPLGGTTVIESVQKASKAELEKLKVKIMANTTVVSATPSGSDTILELRGADGKTTTLTVGAYISATGVIPNTEFAPASFRDDRGYLKQTTRLQAEGHSDIFIIGDAGNLETSKSQLAETQMVHLVKALPGYLDGGKVPEYVVNPKEMYGITIGRDRATGQMGTMKFPSFLIWWLKGRTLGTQHVPAWAIGNKTMATTFQK
ncbi:hypothetical protein G7046_g6026 [Stylonectria norvegica]|nr:hypothetical protein G7046_g6026 [Stylonectria norvegica]